MFWWLRGGAKCGIIFRVNHYRRFVGYDYSRGASLFITVTTSPRCQLFGTVRDAAMLLSDFGRDVRKAIEYTFSHAPGFTLFDFCVMPDHVHFRVYLAPGVASQEAIPLLNRVVGRFKSFTTHLFLTKYGGSGTLWQEGFHDWLCVSREMIDAVERYIAYNALKWELRNNRGLLALREPLSSPRLGGEYWRGVGAVGLLGAEAQQSQDATQAGSRPDFVAPPRATPRLLVALRVSRRCEASDIAALIARIKAKAADLTIISGFISPGERAVMAALIADPRATLVKVSPYALPHDYQPGVALMPAISEGRLAIVARGNSPEEISRAACLDLNDRIVKMADRAVYALPGEWRVLRSGVSL